MLKMTDVDTESDDVSTTSETSVQPLSAAAAAAAMAAAMAESAAARDAIHAAVQGSLEQEPPPAPPRHFFNDDPFVEAALATPSPTEHLAHAAAAALPAELRSRIFTRPTSSTETPPRTPLPPCPLPFASHWHGLRHAIYQPPSPADAMFRGRVRRVRAPGGASGAGVVRYDLSLELPYGARDELYLLSASKLLRSLTPYFAISLSPHDVSRDSPLYVGKLRATSVGGAEWSLFDNGLPPRELRAGDVRSHERSCLLGLQFAPSDEGPPRLLAVLPRADEAKGGAPSRGAADATDGALLKAWHGTGSGASTRRVVGLQSREPHWEATKQAYVLEYGGGRARQPSVKNVQLVAATSPSVPRSAAAAAAEMAASTGDAASSQRAVDVSDAAGDGHGGGSRSATTLFQIGKLGDDEFAVDWRSPLSPMAAFGVALAVCDSKLALSHKLDGIKRVSARRLSRPSSAAQAGGRSSANNARVVPYPGELPT
jgi:hypothetical protein